MGQEGESRGQSTSTPGVEAPVTMDELAERDPSLKSFAGFMESTLDALLHNDNPGLTIARFAETFLAQNQESLPPETVEAINGRRIALAQRSSR